MQQQEIMRIGIRFCLMYVIFVAIIYMIQGQLMLLDGFIFALIYIVLFYSFKTLFGVFKKKSKRRKR
ncbi:MAG: hypothetical protein LRY73_05210 [Bacillus sp. (in: Bacteria)]|nr:hypothetical protein [Bacillus sp. (in: firmicutes)]